MGITSICKAIKYNTSDIIPCSAVLDGEYGLHNFSLTVPAVIGRDGVREIKVLKLASDEQEALKECIDYLSTYMRQMEQNFGVKKNRVYSQRNGER